MKFQSFIEGFRLKIFNAAKILPSNFRLTTTAGLMNSLKQVKYVVKKKWARRRN